MNIKKIMSIGAITLAIISCTSITTFAAESVGDRKAAGVKIAKNFYDGESQEQNSKKDGKVINDVNITINTPIKNYATDVLIKQIQDLDITGFNTDSGIKENLSELMKKQDSLTKIENLIKIKDFIKDKLQEFVDASENGKLEAEVKKYIKVNGYGNLTTGKNMDGKTTLSLENKSGKILLQVNSEEIKDAKAKVTGINSWGDLNNLIKDLTGIAL